MVVMGPEGYLGITPPIDESVPTAEDLASSAALEDALRSLGVYESEDGRAVRQRVITELQEVASAWCASEPGAPADTRCVLRTFGSVRLDVHSPDADIDVVLVAPRHCTRDAFFGSLVKRLSAAQNIGAGRVMPVRDAYTPVIKLRVGETDVDLLLVSLRREALPEGPLDVLDDALLAGLDEAAIRSLNGARVAEMLLRLVPDAVTFRIALRAVKKWAREKGLYSNVLGMLGGVNCAILVAFICQRYPRAASATVVGRFFRVFDAWKWPNAVMLRAPAPAGDEPALPYAAWNPVVNPRDRAHLAPIVTPAHPAMNSSYNVGAPQLRAIADELRLGVAATKRVESLARSHAAKARAPGGGGAEVAAHARLELRDEWRRVLGPSDFFLAHRHYIQIDISASDDDALRRWYAWCESRLRGLLINLDTPGYCRSRPHARAYARDSGGKLVRSVFIGLTFDLKVEHVDLTPTVKEYSNRVHAWDHRAEGMDLSLSHTPRDKLPEAITALAAAARGKRAKGPPNDAARQTDENAARRADADAPAAAMPKQARADEAPAAARTAPAAAAGAAGDARADAEPRHVEAPDASDSPAGFEPADTPKSETTVDDPPDGFFDDAAPRGAAAAAAEGDAAPPAGPDDMDASAPTAAPRPRAAAAPSPPQPDEEAARVRLDREARPDDDTNETQSNLGPGDADAAHACSPPLASASLAAGHAGDDAAIRRPHGVSFDADADADADAAAGDAAPVEGEAAEEGGAPGAADKQSRPSPHKKARAAPAAAADTLRRPRSTSASSGEHSESTGDTAPRHRASPAAKSYAQALLAAAPRQKRQCPS